VSVEISVFLSRKSGLARLLIGGALFVRSGRIFETRFSGKLPGKILHGKFGEDNDSNLDEAV
jgi:hypothetical protein